MRGNMIPKTDGLVKCIVLLVIVSLHHQVHAACPSGWVRDRLKGCIQCKSICQPGSDPYITGECERRCGPEWVTPPPPPPTPSSKSPTKPTTPTQGSTNKREEDQDHTNATTLPRTTTAIPDHVTAGATPSGKKQPSKEHNRSDGTVFNNRAIPSTLTQQATDPEGNGGELPDINKAAVYVTIAVVIAVISIAIVIVKLLHRRRMRPRNQGVQVVDDGRTAEYELYPGMYISRDDENLQVELISVKDLAKEDEESRRGVTVIEITTTVDVPDGGGIDSDQEPAGDDDAILEAAEGIGAAGENSQEASDIEPDDTDNGDNRPTNIPSQTIPNGQSLHLQSGAINLNFGNLPGQTNDDIALVDPTESESTAMVAETDSDDTILKCVVSHSEATPNHISGNSPQVHQEGEQLLSVRTLIQQNNDSNQTVTDQNSGGHEIPETESGSSSDAFERLEQDQAIGHQTMPNTSLSAPIAHPVNNDNAVPAIPNSTSIWVYAEGHQPVGNVRENFLPASAQESNIARELRIDIRDGTVEQPPDGFLQGHIELAETHRLARDSGTSIGSYHTDVSDEDTDRQSDSSSLALGASGSEIDSGRVSETGSTRSTRSYNPASNTTSNL